MSSEALDQFLSDLNDLLGSARQAFQSVEDSESLEAARVNFLGAKAGKLKSLQKGLGKIAKEAKREAGQKFNEVKQEVQAALDGAKSRLSSPAKKQSGPAFDPTPPGKRTRIGRLHPLTQTIEELKQIMGRLGFDVEDGPEIEDEWHNFEALNSPAAHPARDPLENFYLAAAETSTGSPLLMRTQTSTVQIRVMEQRKPPVRMISLGRVYRPDTPDATHYPMFHQIEGLLIDRHVTMAHLKTTLRLFAASFLGEDVHIRFRPSFFPFTEPSVEVDMSWKGGWIEMGGAGMVDPNVLKAVGYEPEEVTGFAFGLGVERVCMRRHGIDDLRDFHANDVRFLHQF
ncbi:MAG: phenylalanine--tRNA ligase subunit alpha [Planctomycetales bacterium]